MLIKQLRMSSFSTSSIVSDVSSGLSSTAEDAPEARTDRSITTSAAQSTRAVDPDQARRLSCQAAATSARGYAKPRLSRTPGA
jgi:hypothetical protein